MAFMGADTDALRDAGQECQEGKEKVDQVIQYLRMLIMALRAAAFFTGGASAAYADYLEGTVVPWLQKISQALGLMAKVLMANADDQDNVSNSGSQVTSGPSIGLPSYSTPGGSLPSQGIEEWQGSLVPGGGSYGDGSVDTGSGWDGQATQPISAGLTGGAPTTTTLTASPSAFGGSFGTADPVGDFANMAIESLTGGTFEGAVGTDLGNNIASVLGSNGLGGLGNLFGGEHTGGWDSATGDTQALGGGAIGGGSGAGLGGGSGSGGGTGGGSGSGGAFGGSGGVGSDGLGSETGSGSLSSYDNGNLASGSFGGGTPDSGEASGAGMGAGTEPTAVRDGGPSYAAAGGIAGGAAALGLGGAALASRVGGSSANGGDSRIDDLSATNHRGSRGEDVRELQERLTAAGYDTQGADGAWGRNTQAAYDAYRADHPMQIREGAGYTSPDGFDYTRIAHVEGNPHVTPEFLRGVEGVAQRLGTRPEYLLTAMSYESNLNPQADNPNSTAYGLIQWMRDTRSGMGITQDQLSRMSSVEQLPYVERYFEGRRGELNSLESVYTTILAGSPHEPGEVLFNRGSAEYAANNHLDINRDGRLTAAEATEVVRRNLRD